MKSNKKIEQKENTIYFVDLILSSFTGILICLGTFMLFILSNIEISSFLIIFSIFSGCYFAIIEYDTYQKLRELKMKGGKNKWKKD